MTIYTYINIRLKFHNVRNGTSNTGLTPIGFTIIGSSRSWPGGHGIYVLLKLNRQANTVKNSATGRTLFQLFVLIFIGESEQFPQ